MAQYLLSVWHDGDYSELDVTGADMERIGRQVGALNARMAEAGIERFGAGLLPASSATVVRPTPGGVTTADGPYSTAVEQMGGFWIIDVDDHDTALEWARRAAEATEGPVELRPMQEG